MNAAAPSPKRPPLTRLLLAVVVAAMIVAATAIWIVWSYIAIPGSIRIVSNETVGLSQSSPIGKTNAANKNHPVSVSGQVVDASGRPVADAQIRLSSDFGSDGANARAMSDAHGNFTVRLQTPAHMVRVMASRPELAPAIVSLKVAAQIPPVRLVLDPGRTIHGFVRNKLGLPISDVTVSIFRWQNIYAPFPSARTNWLGYYKLDHIPSGQIRLSVHKAGYITNVVSVKDDRAISINITIQPPLTIHGSVIDAVTQKPITRFLVTPGARWSPNEPPHFEQYSSHSFSGGGYEQTLAGFGGDIDAWFVRVTARGYLPGISPPMTKSSEQNFELQPGRDSIGRVLDADGNPIAGLSVGVTVPNDDLWIIDGRFNNLTPDQPAVTSDANGRFDLPPQIGKFIIAAVGSPGYAEADQDQFAKSTDLRIAAWGKIEGTLLVDGKSASGEPIDARPTGKSYIANQPNVRFPMNAGTDGAGHFEFNHVPAGRYDVSQVVRSPKDNSVLYTRTQTVTVEPGKTTTVNLGAR